VTIHVASKDGLPIAGILTLSFKKTMVYKYGGSDAAYHPLGGMPFLFWRAIQDAQATGIEELTWAARPDCRVAAFKDHLGATRATWTYYTCPERRTGAVRTTAPAPAPPGGCSATCRMQLDFTAEHFDRHSADAVGLTA
jgi:hypothetical protein